MSANRKDNLGDRMKALEDAYARRVMPLVPVCARLDGRCFSGFTRHLNRPYDLRMSDCMIRLAKFLVTETNALVAYTQSDEISLVWHSTEPNSQIFFDGRVEKMVSILAAMASVEFNRLVALHIPEKVEARPLFDCRVWCVPNRTEAANVFCWREIDCLKNSITMAASHYYSHKQLHGKSGKEKQEMLFKKGINFNDYPAFFKRGTYVRRVAVARRFTSDEIEKLPAKHAARANPDLVVERSEVQIMDFPPLVRIPNREAVLFDGAEILDPSVPL